MEVTQVIPLGFTQDGFVVPTEVIHFRTSGSQAEYFFDDFEMSLGEVGLGRRAPVNNIPVQDQLFRTYATEVGQ